MAQDEASPLSGVLLVCTEHRWLITAALYTSHQQSVSFQWAALLWHQHRGSASLSCSSPLWFLSCDLKREGLGPSISISLFFSLAPNLILSPSSSHHLKWLQRLACPSTSQCKNVEGRGLGPIDQSEFHYVSVSKGRRNHSGLPRDQTFDSITIAF